VSEGRMTNEERERAALRLDAIRAEMVAALKAGQTARAQLLAGDCNDLQAEMGVAGHGLDIRKGDGKAEKAVDPILAMPARTPEERDARKRAMLKAMRDKLVRGHRARRPVLTGTELDPDGQKDV
jgi:hypothetical protein